MNSLNLILRPFDHILVFYHLFLAFRRGEVQEAIFHPILEPYWVVKQS